MAVEGPETISVGIDVPELETGVSTDEKGSAVTCLDLGVHRSTEQQVAGVREETDDGDTLCVAGPGVDARLGDKGLLGASLGGEMGGVRKGGMHVGPALVVGHGLAVEDGGLLAGTAALGLRLLLDDEGLGVLVLIRLLGLVLFDAVEEGGLVLAVPGSPGADVSAVAVDDVEAALVLALALEVALLGVGGADGVDCGEAILEGGVEGAEDCGCVWVDGGVGGVAEDGVCEMLCLEGMVGHGLLLNVAGQRVLVEETVPISKGVVGAVYGQDQVLVGDVYVDLCVGGPGDEDGAVEGVLWRVSRGVRGGGDALVGGHAARDLWRGRVARGCVFSLLRGGRRRRAGRT